MPHTCTSIMICRSPGEPASGKPGRADGDDESYELDEQGPAPKSAGSPAATPPESPVQRPSLLEDRSEPCPSCGKILDPEAVLCIHCGYDLRTHTKLKTQTGVVEVLSPEDQAKEQEREQEALVFSSAARPKPFVIAGLIASLIAVVFAGINTAPESITEPVMQRSPMIIPLRVLLAVVDVAVLSAAGLAAAYLSSLFLRRPLGSIAGVAARLFLATAGFLAIWNQHIPLPYVGQVLKIFIAIAAYGLILFWTFRKDLGLVRFVALTHLSLAVLLGLQSYLWSSVFPFVMR